MGSFSFLKKTAVYGVSVVFRRATAILLVPLFTRKLSQAEYGMYEYFISISQFAILLLSLGVPEALVRFAATKPHSHSGRAYLSTALGTNTALFALLAALSLLLPVNTVILAAVIYAGFFTLNKVFYNYARTAMNATRYTVISILDFCLLFSFNMALLLVLRNIQGIYTAYACAGIALLLLNLGLYRRQLRLPYISANRLKTLLGFGLPVMAASLFLTIMNFSGRLFIKALGTYAQVGVFSLAFRLANLLNIGLIMPFQLIWPIFFLKIRLRPDSDRVIRTIFLLVMLTAVLLFSLLALFARELIFVFGGSGYLPALPMVWPMGLGFVCMLGYYFFSVSIFYTKRTTLMAAISLVVALCHLAANWLLISRLDIYGAALSMLLTFALLFALTYCVAQRIHPLPISTRTILLGALGTAALLFLLQLITPLSLPTRLPAGLLLCLAWLLYIKRYRHALSSL